MKDHCCERMLTEITRRCDDHPDRLQCPDCLVHYDPCFDEYGLIVHDGGSSTVLMAYCPWCGTTLPKSKRDQWYDVLEAQGINPNEDKIPPAFEDDTWWRSA